MPAEITAGGKGSGLRHLRAALLPIFWGALLLSACAHKKAYNKALEFERSGQYAEAARKDLEALDKKPRYEDARIHLRKVAPLAYDELLDRAESFEAAENWVAAVETYSELRTLLRRLQARDIQLQTVDLSKRIARARELGLTTYYAYAERSFETGDYAEAVDQYEKVVALARDYRDARRKLSLAHTALGDGELEAEEYAAAIRHYKRALSYGHDTDTLNRRIAEVYYRWGERLEDDGRYREAMAKFKQALGVVPDYEDAAERARATYERALRRVAILPFRSRTPFGQPFALLLTDELISRCVNARSEFVVFVNRANLEQILDEYRLLEEGYIEDQRAVEMGRLEGIHSFVTGAINQISVETSRPSFVERTHKIKTTVIDSAGKEVEEEKTIYYREYTGQRTVRVGASYQIVDVATGRYLKADNFVETLVDEPHWIRYQGSIYDLPKNKRQYLDAPSEPRLVDAMASDLVRIIAEKMSRRILKYYR